MLQILVQTVLVIIAVPLAGASIYLLLLTLFSARERPLPGSSRARRFEIIVPAHDEAGVIGRTLAGLHAIDWPPGLVRHVVVADNCSDATAAIAREAGASVIERQDPSRRGKGYALQLAFATSAAEGWADACAVVDADAVVSRNFLEAIGARLDQGALAVQVHYGVLNPGASWRTRLMTIAKASFHIVRSRARERLRLSCGLRGNGWCVTHEALRRVPYGAFSLTEDVEYGISLGLAGIRVAYADEAHSDAEMVSGEKASRRQRQRWEQGRFQLIRSKLGPLLHQGFGGPSRICLDLAADLMVLPFSYVVLNLIVLLFAVALASMAGLAGPAWWGLWCACAAALLAYVLRGWQLSGIGLRGVLDLACAPFYLLWKLLIMLRRPESGEWVRTEREKP